ncbi:hypothetical protein FHG87_014098, partial [Trinorchestia longiramus]
MLTELFRLVIRGERNEGRSVEVAAHHLPYVIPQRITNVRLKGGHVAFKHHKPPIPPHPKPTNGASKRKTSKPSLVEDWLSTNHVSVISVEEDFDQNSSDNDDDSLQYSQGVWVHDKNQANVDDEVSTVRRSRSFASSLNDNLPAENFSAVTTAPRGRR